MKLSIVEGLCDYVITDRLSKHMLNRVPESLCILIVLFLDHFHHLSDLVLEAQWATPFKSLESSRPPIKGFILPLILTF